ncbi:MAG: CoA transferase, partial [Alphaproteobacteria bacterium]
AGRPEIAEDARFAKNDGRLRNRAALIPIIREMTSTQTSAFWLRELEKVQVPCGPVNNLQQAFDDPQVKARNMRIEMDHPLGAGGKVPLVASPIKMSKTPPAYRYAPPTLGQHTDEVLRDSLGMEAEEIARLRAAGIL